MNSLKHFIEEIAYETMMPKSLVLMLIHLGRYRKLDIPELEGKINVDDFVN